MDVREADSVKRLSDALPLMHVSTIRHSATTRRCSSCNALLVLYQVGYASVPNQTELITWAAQAQVPAYLISLSSQDAAHRATVTKIYPAGATFSLSARQFYGSVLRELEMQHRCRHS
jgi:hypothetical protein